MIATSVEQSKRLLAIGIKPESADMSYVGYQWNNDVASDLEMETIEPVGGLTVGNMPQDFPAWSLSALWDMIPIQFRAAIHLDLNSEQVIEELVSYIEETFIGYGE